MVNQHRIVQWVVIALLGAIVLAVGSCDVAPVTPTPTPVVEPPKEEICTRPADIEPGEVKTTPYYLTGQVMVSGSSAAMDQAIEQASAELGIPFELLEHCDLDYLAAEGRSDIQAFPLPMPRPGEIGALMEPWLAPAGQDEGFAMRLYRFDDGGDEARVRDVVAFLNRLDRQENPVWADPNYLTGHLAKSSCGAQGSPFGLEGSPFGLEGSGAAFGLNADGSAFMGQWAFERIAAGDFKDDKVTATGEGIRVAIFDTSPFATSGPQMVQTPEVNLALQVINGLNLTPQTTTVTAPPVVKDHGLFVAGLVYALAPDSEIELIQVLDNNGCGDLYWLTRAMHNFMVRTLAERGSLAGVVINLSLGVLQPRNAEETGFPPALAAFQWAMLEAYQRGAVVVAAAGNDSVGDNPRLVMELPAAYPFVLGVAATNVSDKPACFSNKGDVAAPGGDAQPGSATPPECAALAGTCPTDPAAPGQCEWALISLATASPTQYAYWAGTSFATPLASGVAALAHEGRAQADVYARLLNGLTPLGPAVDPTFGRGIINVTNTVP